MQVYQFTYKQKNCSAGVHFQYLKLVSAIFYQIFIFLPNDSPSKSMKNVFILSKKLFSFSRYSIFFDFFPSFPHFLDSKGQMEVE